MGISDIFSTNNKAVSYKHQSLAISSFSGDTTHYLPQGIL